MHSLIVGPTMCGKTTLAEQIAAAWMKRGVNVLVCDPFLGDWPCTWQTRDRTEFIEVAKKSRRCVLIMDETGQYDKHEANAQWPFTVARHWGHKTYALCQHGPQVTPLMRGQCGTVYLFGGSASAAEMFAAEFSEPGLLTANTLPRFHFFMKTRFQPLQGPLKVAV